MGPMVGKRKFSSFCFKDGFCPRYKCFRSTTCSPSSGPTLASNKRRSVAVHGEWRRSALLPRYVRHVAVTEHQRRVIQLLCGDTAWTWTCLPWLHSCWSVVADTLVLILTLVISSWCWSVVADILVPIPTPVTLYLLYRHVKSQLYVHIPRQTWSTDPGQPDLYLLLLARLEKQL